MSHPHEVAPPSTRRPGGPNAVAPLAVGVAAFALYALLCSPFSGAGDASEFTLVLATNGVAHPTGYPLYTLFGHPFVALLHALGVGYPHGANLWSALGGAVAIGFLFALARRLCASAGAGTGAGRRAPGAPAIALAALLPVALFATQPIFLDEATSAEINSWSVAWVCASAWLFARLLAALAPGGGPAGGRGTGRGSARDATRDAGSVRGGAAGWGLACGAGLAHHLTSIFVSVPLTAGLAWALVRGRRPLAAPLLYALVAACLPLSSYGLVAWRAYHPGVVHWPDLGPSLASVWAHVTGEQYRPFLGRFAPAPDQQELLGRIALPFLVAGFAALVVGIARARGAWARATWFALAAAAACVVGFTLRYGVPDPAPYFLPAMALGSAAVAPALLALTAPARRGQALWLGALVLAAALLVVPWVRLGAARRAETALGERMLRSMWAAVPGDSAIVFYPDDHFYQLREYQLLGGEKPSVLVLCPELLLADATRAELLRRYGVDPLAGYPFPTTVPGDPEGERLRVASLRAVMHVLNDRVRVPVIVFDPSVPIVQELRKRPGT